MLENLKKYNESELVKFISQCGAQREAAFKEIYSRFSSRVYLYCQKLTGDSTHADDIFQEVFLKFLNSAECGTQIENVMGYLLRIARNLCLNARRDTKEVPTDLNDLIIPVTERKLESEELEKMIESALELLPSEHKDAFVLQVYEGLSYKEIAELTDVPLTTVRNRVVRAKSKLREILLPYLEDYRI